MRDEKIHVYRVISLDVWGHGNDEHEQWGCDGDCDGYTVNDMHHCGNIELGYDPSDESIVKELIKQGYLTSKCEKKGVIEIDGSDEFFFYINDALDGKPLFQLELDDRVTE